MTDDLSALLEGLPPEVLEQLLGLGTADEQDGLLQQQMAMAEQLRQQPMERYGNPYAQALGGAAHIINTYTGAKQWKDAQNERAGLLQQKTDGRKAYVQGITDFSAKTREEQLAEALRRQRLVAMSIDPAALMR